jgi:hypothetical protein
LVVVAHCAAGAYVLPPTTQPQPVTAESITAVIEPLRAKFPQLLHFVVDGASVSTVAISGMNMFSELAASVGVDVKECDPATTAHIIKTATETRPVMHVLCLGHFVKNRIADATKEFEKKPFAAAAEAMAQVPVFCHRR